ncbi:acylphosphatase [bacterium]|nr:MAG: acylphosphatase [bacterium]
MTRKHLLVRGLVQGVGFRWYALEAASRLGLTGWVRNRPDGVVEAEAQGPAEDVEEFAAALRRGPTAARVDAVEQKDVPAGRTEEAFQIL